MASGSMAMFMDSSRARVGTAFLDFTYSCQASAEHFQQCAEFLPLRNRVLKLRTNVEHNHGIPTALVGTGEHFNKRSPLLDQSRSRLFEIVGVLFSHNCLSRPIPD